MNMKFNMVLIAMILIVILIGGSIATANTSFTDVSNNHWAKSSIERMVEEGYINGYPNGTFGPNDEITRAEFVSILTRMLNLDDKPNPFSDSEHWADQAIGSAVDAGIIFESEYGTSFNPNEAITREEMTKMSARALANENETFEEDLSQLGDTYLPLRDFTSMDDDIVPYVALVHGTGLIGGFEDHSFRLEDKSNRAQAATILNRFSRLKDTSSDDHGALREFVEISTTGTNIESVTGIPTKNIKEDILEFRFTDGMEVTIKHIIAFDETEEYSTFLPMFENFDSLTKGEGESYRFSVEMEVLPTRDMYGFQMNNRFFFGRGGYFPSKEDGENFGYNIMRNEMLEEGKSTVAFMEGGLKKDRNMITFQAYNGSPSYIGIEE
ncbi:S-layer homology domain-containing protein [Desertibacillus haloalkaliphilus]|uniref:S-layer homology domain-containing protein n=1 Tax=Desertibacillus haloalkaliphilus TaxID=1328930 RepID=UPI001C2772B6|nr:S-layer homology domain-containing protein [Desertibacillus haloalkaliphilus]MBU8908051.1 S-layer homology domain-containing protein [Desertibacillus haloalkaliphilus]